MAGICCGVVGEGDTPAPLEPTPRPSRRRSLDILPLKYIADMPMPPPEGLRKRPKLNLRDCDNAIENCDESTGHKVTKKESKVDYADDVVSETKNVTVSEVEEESPKFGVTSVCGRRRDMEDSVSVRPSFTQGFHYFGVFDGHAPAVVAVVTPDKIVVSNCGDSRAVLCRNGVAIPLSSDHKPDRPDELLRVQSKGGRVIYWDGPRVLGVLAMSRAIGDNYLKPYVISEPEVMVTERTEEDECLILASDGLWDVVSNETACGVVRMCLKAQKPPGSPGSDVAADGAVG
ncbi:Protein phosphatase 2C 37 [Glycine soja]|nr:Protein phosphatase 2C 37 [Glycine soja]